MNTSSASPGRCWPFAIALTPSQDQDGSQADASHVAVSSTGKWLIVTAIFVVITIMSATGVPGVNETHYLTKAKHFWNPEWCAQDLFLNSSDAHYAFFLLLGWPTLLVSLEVYTWIGRLACWLAMAYAWYQLNETIGIKKWLMPFTAALMLLLSNNFDMAGEWVVGGFEAKSISYVFVVLSLTRFLRQQWRRFWAWLGLACLFHLVIGVWALFCFATIFFLRPNHTESVKDIRWLNIPPTFWLFLLLCVAAVIPAIAADTATSRAIVLRANEIQVHQRLTHHLLFGSFPTIQVARFVLITIAWSISSIYALALVNDRATFFAFRKFCHASLLITVGGLMLSAVAEEKLTGSDVCNALLKFYWFRFADFAIPLGLSMVCGIACSSILSSTAASRRLACSVALSAIALAALVSTLEIHVDARPPAAQVSLPTYPDDDRRTQQSYENFVKACEWASSNTASDAVFVTPFKQQIFKWYSDRAEVACWKDAPQDATGIVEWKTRINWLSSFDRLPAGILQINAEQVAALRERSAATHVLAPQSHEDIAVEQGILSPSLRKVYPDDPETRSTYVIYELLVE